MALLRDWAMHRGPVRFTHTASSSDPIVPGWAYDMVLINAHVPIDENQLELRFGATLRTGDANVARNVILQHVAAARDGYFQDVAIWEHKRWRDRPLLVDGDGSIGKIREWYQSFFTEATWDRS